MPKIGIISLVPMELQGITSVIYNYTLNMDKTDIVMEFITHGDIPDSVLKDFSQIGPMHILSHRKASLLQYAKDLTKLLKKQKYDAVHIHGNSGTMLIESLIAKYCQVKKIIVHVHNTSCNYPALNKVLVPIMKCLATDYAACSPDAGKWLYGKTPFTVFNNAIDPVLYRFDSQICKEVRDEFSIGDATLIGHIGHFSTQKNHTFLIDIFEKFHSQNKNSKLLLIGDGPFLSDIQNKVSALGLQESVIFAGKRTACHRLYQAMDLFVLPSLWEGLPLVIMEAQAAGLPILASTAVPTEAKIRNCMYRMELTEGVDAWANQMQEILQTHKAHEDNPETDIARAGFDIRQEAKKLRHLYLR